MPKGLTFATTLAFAAVMALPQLAIAEPDADTVVARVNNQDITLGHVIVATATLPQQYRQLPSSIGGRVRVGVSKLDEIEGEDYVTQRDVIRELSS